MGRVHHAREPRVVARCRIEFERLDRRVVAESEDLSRHGAFVRTDELLPAGAITELDLRLPDGAIFHIVARVAHLLTPSAARALGRHVGMGFEFLEAEGDALAHYLDDLIDDLTPPPTIVADRVRLVVADPSAPLRARLVAALEPAGYVVESYGDGAQALAACVARPPGGVLTAIAMPALDGLGLIRALGIHARLGRVPVVVLSDDDSDLVRLEAYRLGVRDCLTRPFLDEELVIRVRRATVAHLAAGPELPGSAPAALRGELAEISLPTLLSLFEFERKSGTLTVTSASQVSRLSLAGGRVLRVDGGGRGSARVRLMAVLDSVTGHFEFVGGVVVGTDEVAMPTTQLLLEHARVRDEARQQRGSGAR